MGNIDEVIALGDQFESVLNACTLKGIAELLGLREWYVRVFRSVHD
jgi:hypothetical protein